LPSGVILDCGDTVTCTVPIYDGFLIESGVQQLDFGGREITSYILRPGLQGYHGDIMGISWGYQG
jgi:actin-related protein